MSRRRQTTDETDPRAGDDQHAPDGSEAPPPVPPEQPVRTNAGAAPATPAVPPADASPEPDGPVEWAADLVRELGKTGTGAAKLEVIRRKQLERFNDPRHAGKDPAHPDRHLTAREALAAIETPDEHGGYPVPELTRQKARAIVETGRYVPAVAATVHAADALPPPPRGKAPARKAEPPKPAEDMDQARPRGRRDPGVHDLSAGFGGETVGPKPTE